MTTHQRSHVNYLYKLLSAQIDVEEVSTDFCLVVYMIINGEIESLEVIGKIILRYPHYFIVSKPESGFPLQ